MKQLKTRLSQTNYVKKTLADPVDLSVFKEKPNVKFLIGIAIVGLSYLIAWPLISLLGILAWYFSYPLLFVVGSPVAYGTSHLVFIAGVWIAGKDCINYLNIFSRWGNRQILLKIFNE